ncbi:uncharacterized protein LOC127568554 [Pristis pectinata]|uniref:uncharacterized protein LOC127568554 n=1 Tax=Pristis pectinata TaxID=685728 RepID=UPI00223D8009|nr:uncharacterized protein LOC127568554 [Pristis pectinata]
MEMVERWKMCLCLFVAVLFTSLENSTEDPSDLMETTSGNATALFNLSSNTMGLVKSTARTTSGNTDHDTDLDGFVGLSSIPKNGTVFNNSVENSTVNVLTHNAEISELTKKNEMSTSVTDGAPQAGNETQLGVSKPTVRSTNTSSLDTKSVYSAVDPNVTERNGHLMKTEPTVEMTRIPQQIGTTGKIYATAQESGSETTVEPKNVSLATFAGHEESKELANDTLTAEPVTLPVLSTLQESKTTPNTVTPSVPVGISTTMETTPTIRPSPIHATETVATSRTFINEATTSFSAQQNKDNIVNAKKMVNGKPISNLSQTKWTHWL